VYNKETNHYKENAQSTAKTENKVSLRTELRTQNSFSQMLLQQKTKVCDLSPNINVTNILTQ